MNLKFFPNLFPGFNLGKKKKKGKPPRIPGRTKNIGTKNKSVPATDPQKKKRRKIAKASRRKNRPKKKK